MIRADLRTWLLSSTAIAAIVGPAGVRSSRAPDQPRPYIVVDIIGETEDLTLDGAGGDVEYRAQVDIWADDEPTAETLKAAVRNRIHGYRGVWGSRAIKLALKESALDQIALPRDASAATPYRRTLDFRVFTEEPTPTHA